MLIEDAARLLDRDAVVPGVLGIHHHHRAVAALREAAGVVHAHLLGDARVPTGVLERLEGELGIGGLAGLARRADEYVLRVLGHM
jgi:hypothetical protein